MEMAARVSGRAEECAQAAFDAAPARVDARGDRAGCPRALATVSRKWLRPWYNCDGSGCGGSV